MIIGLDCNQAALELVRGYAAGRRDEGVELTRQAGSHYIGYGGTVKIATIDIIWSERNIVGNLVGLLPGRADACSPARARIRARYSCTAAPQPIPRRSQPCHERWGDLRRPGRCIPGRAGRGGAAHQPGHRIARHDDGEYVDTGVWVRLLEDTTGQSSWAGQAVSAAPRPARPEGGGSGEDGAVVSSRAPP
jgi:hypothetical protein